MGRFHHRLHRTVAAGFDRLSRSHVPGACLHPTQAVGAGPGRPVRRHSPQPQPGTRLLLQGLSTQKVSQPLFSPNNTLAFYYIVKLSHFLSSPNNTLAYYYRACLLRKLVNHYFLQTTPLPSITLLNLVILYHPQTIPSPTTTEPVYSES